MNPRVGDGARLISPSAATPDAEYAVETYYGFHLAHVVTLQPNVQWIHHPGGFRDRSDVVFLGVKTTARLGF